MSFNKKYINKEALIERFRLEGHRGVINYIGNSEALIGLDDELEEILNISYCDSCSTKKDFEIKKIIDGE